MVYKLHEKKGNYILLSAKFECLLSYTHIIIHYFTVGLFGWRPRGVYATYMTNIIVFTYDGNIFRRTSNCSREKIELAEKHEWNLRYVMDKNLILTTSMSASLEWDPIVLTKFIVACIIFFNLTYFTVKSKAIQKKKFTPYFWIEELMKMWWIFFKNCRTFFTNAFNGSQKPKICNTLQEHNIVLEVNSIFHELN